MGLGDGPNWWDDFEWVRLPDLTDADLAVLERRSAGPGDRGQRGGRSRGGQRDVAGGRGDGAPAPDAALAGVDLAEALREQVDEARVWAGSGPRLLLVDLDNLRAGPSRWQARMAVIVGLADDADHVALAGQVGAVERALPHLAGYAGLAEAVPDGSDLADHALLAAARAYAAGAAGGRPGQVVVASNDGIFAELADEGWSLTVLSPGREALSDRLRDAARRTVDLVDAERAATRRWRSRALRAAALTPRRAAAGRAGRGARRTTRRRARSTRG